MLVQDGVEGGGDLVHRQEILFREGCGDELDVEHLAQLCGGFDGRGSIPLDALIDAASDDPDVGSVADEVHKHRQQHGRILST